MNEQLAKPEVSLSQRGLVIALIISLAIAIGLLVGHQFQHTDPYFTKVLSMEGDTVQGHAIFQINCSGCHGIMADGRVGPSLRGISSRKSRSRLIDQVTSGKTPPMPKFQPNPREMADLLSYLETL